MNAYEVYQTFIALKLHFSSDYDYHKYNGKTTATLESFEKRNDKWSFQKLTKHKDPFHYILANLLNNPSYSPIEYKIRDTDKPYYDWLKRNQSLTYTFQQDLNKLDHDFNSNFIIKKYKLSFEYPNILLLYLRGEISAETATILIDLTKVEEYWLNKFAKGGKESGIFLEKIQRLKKYRPFLIYDRDMFRNIVMKKWLHELQTGRRDLFKGAPG